jgi:UDP-2,3-diacylglucosamine pyrophosphatase LpxH
MRKVSLLYLCLLIIIGSAAQGAPVSAQLRPIYIISDLHMGVGRTDGFSWNRLEDFRWPRAFDGFLTQISKDHPKGVDLIIAGDMLELWQHPTASCTKLRDTECGCSIEEMKRIVKDVLAGHKSEFEAIGLFLSRPENRMVIIPGNHDAALIEDEIWMLLVQAVPKGRERFVRIKSGTWSTDDNKVVVEHGHQQDALDVNTFPGWPDRITKNCADGVRFFRPWGENLVQTLFNEREEEIPLIDNLIPESFGTSIYLQYSKEKGTKYEDIARFVIFNLLQTSPYQKITALDVSKERTALNDRSIDFCRRCIGEDLILLSPEGQWTNSISGIAGTEGEKAFRLELRQQVASLDGNAIRDLCERRIVAGKGRLAANPDLADQPGCEATLGMAAKMIFDPDGMHLLRNRFDILSDQKKSMLIYVFGHTHDAKIQMQVPVNDGSIINALNSGAFMRLMDNVYFNKSKKAGEKDTNALKRLTHDDMKACYTTIAIIYDEKNMPQAKLKQWNQTEDSSSTGKFVDACSQECSARPANCR